MKPYLFTKGQRRATIFILSIIFLMQVIIFLLRKRNIEPSSQVSQNERVQAFIDSVKKARISNKSHKKTNYKFNPNYISDYKGYLLGMSTKQIDLLHKYRQEGHFINSKKEFQEVTKVSDALLDSISPYFKFPEWTKKKVKSAYHQKQTTSTKKININQATRKELRSIRGIGETLSERILKFRKLIGGFSDKNQLYEVYGLKDEVVKRIWNGFEIINPPAIRKISVNNSTAGELSEIYFISYSKALEIVAYRTKFKQIKNIDEVKKILNLKSKEGLKVDRHLKL